MKIQTIKELCEEFNFSKDLEEHLKNLEICYELIKQNNKIKNDCSIVDWVMVSIDGANKNTKLLEGLTLKEQILFNIGTLQGLVDATIELNGLNVGLRETHE